MLLSGAIRRWSPVMWTQVIAGLVAVGATGGMAASAVWQLTGQPTAAAAPSVPAGNWDRRPLYPEFPAIVDVPDTRPVPLRDGAEQYRSGRDAPGLPTARGIPARVLAAYQNAVNVLGRENPGCRLTTPLLAAIGRVESGHARGGSVDARGTTAAPILGPRLDGSPGVAAIRDTDDGAYDGDTSWDRAVGPMQFIPTTWNRWGADGNGDGVADPHNVDDATLAAGRYLCAAGGDLDEPDGLRGAVLAYNHSQQYLELVLAWMRAYSGGTVAVGNTQTQSPSSRPAEKPRPADEPRRSEDRRPPEESPSPSPTRPPEQREPDDPAPAPDPIPQPPVPVTGMAPASHQDLNPRP